MAKIDDENYEEDFEEDVAVKKQAKPKGSDEPEKPKGVSKERSVERDNKSEHSVGTSKPERVKRI